jgi:hypothetical protein
MIEASAFEWWQQDGFRTYAVRRCSSTSKESATAVVRLRADDVDLSCASRAAFLPFLLQVDLCSCIGPPGDYTVPSYELCCNQQRVLLANRCVNDVP